MFNEMIDECQQLVLEVLTFHMLSTWVKHQYKYQFKYSETFLMPKILWYAQNSQYVQNYIFLAGKHIFVNSLINS